MKTETQPGPNFLAHVILSIVSEVPCPSGHLYAAMMTKNVTLEQYEAAISYLRQMGAITTKSYLVEATPLGKTINKKAEELLKAKTV